MIVCAKQSRWLNVVYGIWQVQKPNQSVSQLVTAISYVVPTYSVMVIKCLICNHQGTVELGGISECRDKEKVQKDLRLAPIKSKLKTLRYRKSDSIFVQKCISKFDLYQSMPRAGCLLEISATLHKNVWASYILNTLSCCKHTAAQTNYKQIILLSNICQR